MLPFRRSLLAILALGLACRGEGGDPVRQALDRVVQAADKRDAAAVVANLSETYRDAEGQAPADVSAVLRRYFAAYEILDVKISSVEIERAPEAARARFRAQLSGQPVKLGGLDSFLPSASKYDFDVRLVPEGGRWKVAWASWQPAQ